MTTTAESVLTLIRRSKRTLFCGEIADKLGIPVAEVSAALDELKQSGRVDLRRASTEAER